MSMLRLLLCQRQCSYEQVTTDVLVENYILKRLNDTITWQFQWSLAFREPCHHLYRLTSLRQTKKKDSYMQCHHMPSGSFHARSTGWAAASHTFRWKKSHELRLHQINWNQNTLPKINFFFCNFLKIAQTPKFGRLRNCMTWLDQYRPVPASRITSWIAIYPCPGRVWWPPCWLGKTNF